MAELTLSILGPFHATLDGEPLTKFRTKKAQALLIYLAVENTPARRDFLMDLLWPGLPQQSAQVSLRQTLYQLRQAIPGLPATDRQASVPIVLSDREVIQIHPDARYQLDLHNFASLIQKDKAFWPEAISLYRGDFLEDFYLSDSSPFTDWIQSHRAHLRRQVLDLLNKLTEVALVEEQLDKAEQYARRQLEIDNLSEAAHRQLMTILANLDHRVEALAQYDSLRQLLLAELNIEPSATTQALVASIRAGAVSTVPQPIQESDERRILPPFLEGAGERASPSDTAFIANQAHLTKLGEALEQALLGQGQIVFITGGPGWGKSTLMDAFAHRAQAKHADLIVAMGRCTAYTGTGDPYLPFREIMQQLAGDVEGLWRAGVLSRDQTQRLWQGMPLLSQVLAQSGSDLVDIFIPGEALLARVKSAVTTNPTWLTRLQTVCERRWQVQANIAQVDLFQQFTNVLDAFAEHAPVLLLLDDLHWIDKASLSLLFHLGRRLAGTRILIVCSFRPEDVVIGRQGERHPLASVLNEFKRQYGDIVISLEDMQEKERQAFVATFLDLEPNQLSPTFRQAFSQYTGGHPLFTVELWRDLQQRQDVVLNKQGEWEAQSILDWEKLPLRVEGVIAEQLARLPDMLREMLTIGSVEGESFTAQVIAQVQQAHTHDVVREISRELDQKHHLVRERGSKQVNGNHLFRFRFRHQLFQHYLYQELSLSERQLLHGEIGQALEAVYGTQVQTIAPHLAWHFTEAGITEKAGLYLQQAGEQAAASYAHEEAIAYFSQALAHLTDTDIMTRYELLLAREDSYHWQGNREAQRADLDTLALLADSLSTTEQATVAFRRVKYANAINDYSAAIAAVQVAIKLAQTLADTSLVAKAHRLWGDALWPQKQNPAAKIQFETGLQLAQKVGDQQVIADCLNGLGNVALNQGDYAGAHVYFEQSLAIQREIGDRLGEGNSLNNLGNVALSQGDYAGARVYYEQSLAIQREMGHRRGEGYSLNNLGNVAGRQGDYAGAHVCFEQSLAIKREIGDRRGEGMSLNNLGYVALNQGDYGTAKGQFEQSLAIRREIGDRRGEGYSLSNLGRVVWNQGDYGAAKEYFKQSLAIRREIGDRLEEGYSLNDLGSVALALANLPLAETYYQQALTIHQELNQPRHLAEDWAGLAQLKLAKGDQKSAGRYGQQILDYLKENPRLIGIDNPMRTFRFTWEVLVALGQTSEADDVLTLAVQVMQDYLDKNSDHALREMYLRQPHHRILWAAWQKRQ